MNIDSRVTLCPDGKYRWTYEVNLYKNMSMFYDLMKVMGISLGFVFAIMIFALINNGIDWDSLMTGLWGFVWVSVGFIVLCLVGYWIWARVSGGRYAALFVMDDEGVTHQEMAFSPLAASFTAWKSDFKTVRRVIPKRRRHLIKVNELFTKNRVYVEDREDYEFVLDFIRQRCPRIHI